MSDEKKVGYVGQFSAALSQDGMTISVNFNMPESASAADFGAKLDMLRTVVARQRAQSEIKLLEATILEKEAVLRNFELDLAQYAKSHSAEDDHAERTKARIDELKADLARGKKELAATKLQAL